MKKILIIDDNIVNREQAAQMIQRMQAEAVSFADGPSGVDYLRSRDVDLILMDIRMPGMDGAQVTKIIRDAERPRGRTPIIALTAYGGVDQFEPYRQAGMNGFISKPLTLEKMKDIFDRWIEKKPQVIQQRIERKSRIKFGFWRDPV